MKKMNKIFSLLALTGVFMFSSCIEETEPASGIATEKQVGESSIATEAMVMAMPAYCHTRMWSDRHNNFGYGSMMHVRDLQTGDCVMEFSADGYDNWFNKWTQNKYMGQDYFYAQYQFLYYYRFMQAVNNVISAIDPENCTDQQRAWYGSALAYRAMLYLDLARMYEFLPNDKTSNINADGNDVAGLTVPIVRAGMSEAEARNNPRAPHAEMAKFIEEDLDEAEKYIGGMTEEATSGHILPDLACAYGLKARLYMWDGQYDKAKEYARKAINTTARTPMTQQQCMNTTTGFNVAGPWMWAAQQTATTSTVTSGIVNWTSWVSNQCTFAYTGPATNLFVVIDKRMYDRISDTDWRKLQWIGPEGSPLNDQIQSVVSLEAGPVNQYLIPYVSVKFRPGQGNSDDSNIGAATAIPVMRVEEMYFIEAEAAEHVSAGSGAALLTSFMKQYRDPNYTFTDQGFGAVEEIVFQKRVELWGEGQTFFDIKRLDMSVTRGYSGTNCTDARSCLNTNGRPAWMNLVMVRTESNNNHALEGMNNPDPSDLYTPWTE